MGGADVAIPVTASSCAPRCSNFTNVPSATVFHASLFTEDPEGGFETCLIFLFVPCYLFGMFVGCPVWNSVSANGPPFPLLFLYSHYCGLPLSDKVIASALTLAGAVADYSVAYDFIHRGALPSLRGGNAPNALVFLVLRFVEVLPAKSGRD